MKTLLSLALASTTACTVTTTPTPRSCQDVGVEIDGLYTLFVDGDKSMPWVAYCLVESEATYLPLIHQTAGANTAMLTDGASDLSTSYKMLHVDTGDLVVDVFDQRFATSTDAKISMADGPQTSVPFGFARVWTEEGIVAKAKANIDLRGTSFRVLSSFMAFDGVTADVTRTHGDKVIDIVAQGSRGQVAPSSLRVMPQDRLISLLYSPCNADEDGVCGDTAAEAGVEVVPE